MINPNKIVATSLSNEVVLMFDSNEDLDGQMELIQSWEIPMEKVYDFLETLQRFPQVNDNDVITKAKALIHKMELVNKVEDDLNSIHVQR